MFLLFALLACADPEPIALQTCEAIPTVAATPESLALFEPLLTAEEYALLASQSPTLGIVAMGEPELASLRAGAKCTVVETLRAGQGRWKVILDRTVPTLPPSHFEWYVVQEDAGLRVQTELSRYTSMRASIAEGLKTDDHDRAVALWRSMMDGYGDPTLVHDLAAAEAVRANYMYGRKLGTQVKGIDGDELVGTLYNRGDLDLPLVKLKFVFTGPEGESQEVEVEVSSVPRQAEVEVRTLKPKWDRLKKARIELVDWKIE